MFRDMLRFKQQIPEEECIVSVIAIGKRASEPVLGKRKDLAEVAKFF